MDSYWYCGVQVRGIGRTYSYISDIGEIPAGSYVEVPFGHDDILVIGCVMTSGEYAAERTPYPVEKTKHIHRIATVEEYEDQIPISSYDDEDELVEIDEYIKMKWWEEVLEWAIAHHDSPYEHIGRKVIKCYELCMEQGIAVAALNLGTFYYKGKFVEQNFEKAFELYKIAADAGELRAICNCGYCYYYGRHQETDYGEALKYFSIGALLYQDANCLYKLGDMYLYGYGVDRNENYAYLLYDRALSRCQEEPDNNSCIGDVQLRIGKCLLKGIGVKINIEKAYEFLSFSLLNFYKRRKTDNFVSGPIRSAKELMAEVQEKLDADLSVG